MLDGTAIKEALENGKNAEARDCDTIYPGCPIDKQSSMQILTKLLPKNGQWIYDSFTTKRWNEIPLLSLIIFVMNSIFIIQKIIILTNIEWLIFKI